MPKLIKALGLTVLLLFPTILAWSQAENSPLSKVILVHAEVIEIKEDDNGVLCTLKVTHVYCGPEDLLGRTFLAHSGNVHDIHGWSILPVLKPGEAGIWILKVSSEVGLMRVMRSDFFPGVRSPTREHVSSRYKQAKALAEAVEHICKKAAPQESPKLLKKYALSEIFEISAWAIRTLGELKPEGSLKFLENLVSNGQLPVVGQVALDEVLCELKGNAWQDSKERLTFLQKWVTGEMDEHDAYAAISRLDLGSQRGQLGHGTFLDLLKMAIKNQGLPLKVRRSACFWVGLNARRSKEHEDSFEFLMQVIREQKEEEIVSGAAYAIRNYITLNHEQVDAVKALLAELDNDKIAEPLIGALLLAGVQIPNENELVPEQRETAKAAGWIVPCLMIAFVLLAGVVVFLLLRRKGAQA